ncbi:hypothetical protein CI238_13113 [Colletotrichum incanum]|uniref:Uncharacterized protein n=1 Tax=Colletotrichum incanum TaxID=1573173 RepID=A0A161W4W0_COLIC|nr:hypothetical protein CI238_13113 [Colletotrichum incanum]
MWHAKLAVRRRKKKCRGQPSHCMRTQQPSRCSDNAPRIVGTQLALVESDKLPAVAEPANIVPELGTTVPVTADPTLEGDDTCVVQPHSPPGAGPVPGPWMLDGRSVAASLSPERPAADRLVAPLPTCQHHLLLSQAIMDAGPSGVATSGLAPADVCIFIYLALCIPFHGLDPDQASEFLSRLQPLTALAETMSRCYDCIRTAGTASLHSLLVGLLITNIALSFNLFLRHRCRIATLFTSNRELLEVKFGNKVEDEAGLQLTASAAEVNIVLAMVVRPMLQRLSAVCEAAVHDACAPYREYHVISVPFSRGSNPDTPAAPSPTAELESRWHGSLISSRALSQASSAVAEAICALNMMETEARSK